MAKKEETQVRGLASAKGGFTSCTYGPLLRNRQVDAAGHYFEGDGDWGLKSGYHKYFSKNALGKSDITAEDLMKLVKSNIESIFPGGASCRPSEAMSNGTKCNLTLFRFPVKAVEVTDTSFTLKAYGWHVFRGTAKHVIVKEGKDLFLVQEGEGFQPLLSCINESKAESLWMTMATNIRFLMIRENLLKPTDDTEQISKLRLLYQQRSVDGKKPFF